MSDIRVKFSVDHLKDEITQFLYAEASSEAEVIAAAVCSAVDTYDIGAAVEDICRKELDKFVADVAGAYFRALLKSNDAHAVVRDALARQLGEG